MERKSLKRKGLDLNYCDFNVATMEDTKGGFLLDESQPEPESNVGTGKMPTIGIGCEICSSIDLDFKMEEHYGVQVCLKCVKDEPDKYSLLTKTEVKADYLLTESEMKSLKFLTKPNPHKQSYSNMMLYLRKQVEERAFSKWGSEKQLDVEFDRRKQKSLAQKESAFKKKLLELRRKTRTALWTGGDKSDHQHEFSTPEAHGEDMYRQTCKICSIVVTFESM